MNLAFNELSFQPMVDNEHLLKDKLIMAANVLKLANTNYGFSHIVFPNHLGEIKVVGDKTFYEWAYAIPHQGDKNKILALTNKKQFTNDVLKDQVVDLNAYYFENSELGIEQTYCHGLATAHLTETAAISLCTHTFWEQNTIGFFKENLVTEHVRAYNICLDSSFEDEILDTYLGNIAKIELIKTTLMPDEKSHHFRDDHGTDVLTAFANRLKNSEYIISIINSLPFNSQITQFIRRIHPDGKIEIVLYWEDKGYGMVVQTTGRNFRETKAIAQKLKDKYDK